MIGVRIREVRNSRNMTVKQLAEAAEVSTGLISQVERGLTDPSLETLRRLARALGLPLFDLFREQEQEAVAVVRQTRRIVVRSPNGGIAYTRVSPGAGRLEVLEGVLEPGGASSAEAWSHPSEECIVVLAGRLVVEAAGERYELGQGDSCYLDSRIPHRYVNEGTIAVTFLVSVTPPSY
ncbi:MULTISPECIES: helix-turn-helix domain-containing protein [Actinomadura]|uniref:Helix-turn-helix domain-containing protein n=1 Tax=Actinomadura yumaensis TaxID=111807 RepID=A0ABW2CPA0_9ACTN|nr:XRE family transcriptional regulator [Actinomadura sp. J1-007]MWK36469.1 cupin domain-containing protein [Actinomadura sp. J1-007]